MKEPTIKSMLIVIVIVVLVIVGYLVLNAPDRRNTSEKVGDAIHELPEGPDKATRELKDRTPGEKLHDAINDTINK